MPPKPSASKKDLAAQKEKEKAVQKKERSERKAQAAADRTFGLKNKGKSKVVQTFVKQQQLNAVPLTDKQKRAAAEKEAAEKKAKKQAELDSMQELNALFAEAIKQPKLPEGVDPKSVLCEFFRHGKCQKGFKCKYSHDLKIGKKSEKKALYEEEATPEEAGGEPPPPNPEHEDMYKGMEDWDQVRLEEAIAKKEAEANQNRATDIICKHFLEAVEKKVYGWFWKCPMDVTGGGCKYKHALPKGYIMKSEMQTLLAQERADMPTQEESVEAQRKSLLASTPVTPEIYKEWKEKWDRMRRDKRNDKKAELRAKDKISGRDLFEQNMASAADDEDDEPTGSQKVESGGGATSASKADGGAKAAATDDVANELTEEDFEGLDDLNEEDLAELEAEFQEASLKEEAIIAAMFD